MRYRPRFAVNEISEGHLNFLEMQASKPGLIRSQVYKVHLCPLIRWGHNYCETVITTLGLELLTGVVGWNPRNLVWFVFTGPFICDRSPVDVSLLTARPDVPEIRIG
jgi:hypothetical protein